MSRISISSLLQTTRRELLISLRNALDDPETLKDVVGKNVCIDCTLYMLASNNEKLLNNLSKVTNVYDLLDEIDNINRNQELHELLNKKLNKERFS